jgi:hypothetical protein
MAETPTRPAVLAILLALSLTNCAGSPLRQERDARAEYDQATKAYVACLNANPSNLQACEAAKVAMETEERHWRNLNEALPPALGGTASQTGNTVTKRSLAAPPWSACDAHVGRNSETDAYVLPAFRQGLNRPGYVEGRNVTIKYRWSDTQYDRLPALIGDAEPSDNRHCWLLRPRHDRPRPARRLEWGHLSLRRRDEPQLSPLRVGEAGRLERPPLHTPPPACASD